MSWTGGDYRKKAGFLPQVEALEVRALPSSTAPQLIIIDNPSFTALAVVAEVEAGPDSAANADAPGEIEAPEANDTPLSSWPAVELLDVAERWLPAAEGFEWRQAPAVEPTLLPPTASVELIVLDMIAAGLASPMPRPDIFWAHYGEAAPPNDRQPAAGETGEAGETPKPSEPDRQPQTVPPTLPPSREEQQQDNPQPAQTSAAVNRQESVAVAQGNRIAPAKLIVIILLVRWKPQMKSRAPPCGGRHEKGQTKRLPFFVCPRLWTSFFGSPQLLWNPRSQALP